MARFVECNGLFFLFRNDFCPLFQSSDNPIYCIQEILVNDLFASLSGCIQSGFVAYVGNICTAKSRSLARQEVDINGVVNFDWSKVHFEDCQTLR